MTTQAVLDSTPLRTLVSKLRVGQRWLVSEWREIQDADEVSDLKDKRFLTGIDKWDELDHELRVTHHYVGCPMGPAGCSEDSPIICRHCAEKRRIEAEKAAAPVAIPLFPLPRIY